MTAALNAAAADPAPSTTGKRFKVAPVPACSDPLYRRINNAIKNRVASDVKEDIISDIMVMLYSGQIAEADITGALINKQISRGITQYANNYGPASLDTLIGEYGEETWVECIEDSEQEDTLRLLALKNLAVRVGVDPEAALDAEDGPRDRYRDRHPLPRRRGGPRGPRVQHSYPHPAARPLIDEADRIERSLRFLDYRDPRCDSYRRRLATLRTQIAGYPEGRYTTKPDGSWGWVAWESGREYPLIGETDVGRYRADRHPHGQSIG